MAFGQILRLVVIFLGFVAMWRLWVARDLRYENWTRKMKDIWLCHFLSILAFIEGNTELFYRQTKPTLSLFLVVFIELWTIRGSFGEGYTLKYTGKYTKKH